MRQATHPVRVAEIDAHEGPVYLPEEDALYFTTLPQRDADGVPRVQIKRLSLDGRSSVVRDDANAANGMALAPGGRLLVGDSVRDKLAAKLGDGFLRRFEKGHVGLQERAGIERLMADAGLEVVSSRVVWLGLYAFVTGAKPGNH